MRMVRHGAALAVLLVAAAATGSAAPPVELPTEVKGEPGAFVPVRGKTAGKVVQFVPLDAGLNVFPADLLADKKATVVSAAKPGRYRLLAYSAIGDDPTEPSTVTVVIGSPPADPPTTPPTNPPVNPPPAPTAYYFLIVRPDGPADPAFTKAMSLPAWAALRAKGHTFKDKTASAARADVGVELPPGAALPCVVTLSVSGGASKIVRGPVPLPTTDAGVAALPEGVR